jgi:hypothetical protein
LVCQAHDRRDLAHRHPGVVGGADGCVPILPKRLQVLPELRVPLRMLGRELLESGTGLGRFALRPSDPQIVGVILANELAKTPIRWAITPVHRRTEASTICGVAVPD